MATVLFNSCETTLRAPQLCLTAKAARDEGLTGSFAMIRLQDQSVVVSLPVLATVRGTSRGWNAESPVMAPGVLVTLAPAG